MFGLSRSVEVALGVGSVGMFVATLVAIPVILVRVPNDWFVRPPPAHSLPYKVLRAVVGLALIALGVAMIVLPGQGVLTILVGLSILDLPIKHRIVAKILCNPKVHGAIDKLRRKAGKGSLQIPSSSVSPSPA
jgi:hypothetical protein